MKTQAD